VGLFCVCIDQGGCSLVSMYVYVGDRVVVLLCEWVICVCADVFVCGGFVFLWM